MLGWEGGRCHLIKSQFVVSEEERCYAGLTLPTGEDEIWVRQGSRREEECVVNRRGNVCCGDGRKDNNCRTVH